MEVKQDDLSRAPDAEEKMFVPAGVTYFEQFIDHDLSFDTTSTFDGVSPPTNLCTPKLDLNCVYEKGPINRPDMYEADYASLKLGNLISDQRQDLLPGEDEMPSSETSATTKIRSSAKSRRQ